MISVNRERQRKKEVVTYVGTMVVVVVVRVIVGGACHLVWSTIRGHSNPSGL